MSASFVNWFRRPGIPLRVALITLVLAILFLAPIYFEHQWAAAQSALAPWWIAMARVPFFAGLMVFIYYPAYWVLLYGLWALTAVAWIYTLVMWRRGRRQVPSANSAVPNAAAHGLS